MKTTININDYLSEEDKKEIASEVFKNTIIEGLKRDSFGSLTVNKSDRLSNFDRVMSNAVYYIIEKESDELLGDNINLQEVIRTNVTNTILNKKDYDYSIFRRKGIYETEDSLGQKILNQAVLDNTEYIKKKVKLYIDNFFKEKSEDFIEEIIMDGIRDLVNEKLKS